MNRISLVVIIFLYLVCLTASEINQSGLTDKSRAKPSNPATGSDAETVYVAATDKVLWDQATCKGAKLLFGTTLNPDQAVLHCTPLTTPWHGTLVNELTTWGYNDISDDENRKGACDFKTKYSGLTRAFGALGISMRDYKDGGPNRCFMVVHYNGPAVEKNPDGSLPQKSTQQYTVNGRRYRVTGAHFIIGVNSRDGYIFLIDRSSPETQARNLWNIAPQIPIPRDEMPALRSSSDIGWGFWNRVSGHNLGGINAFFSFEVVNEDTGRIIEMAMEKSGHDEVPPWPGVRFDSGTEEYRALLGSPNGIAAGYLLAQHKREIGGNKYVSHIIVFMEDDPTGWPNLLFKVDWAPPPPPHPASTRALHAKSIGDNAQELQNEEPNIMERAKVLGSSRDGKHIVREHVIRAN
ncbi:hypothetical protein COCMIDRAFT_104432 [Bipolaris oryzae ATCC 44560]|uniref:Uncharacterized protein n=1 Tax=Bipolaris oryzae ATCC 44560 TaxID=930090 RepID=W6YX34_COCMI|nr:uncharacterized protein COCMIDRAFT_104432 [Bipolaris oryzae ATCC 44560]EUC42083.1 hypothetical protein COCMIDRAFT_104432 [Bipolaris oryzae ATCC 44560]